MTRHLPGLLSVASNRALPPMTRQIKEVQRPEKAAVVRGKSLEHGLFRNFCKPNSRDRDFRSLPVVTYPFGRSSASSVMVI